MTQLLALSFDSETSPSIRLRALEGGTRPAASVYGWGVAWYPSDGAAAMVIKDPTSLGHDALTHVLSDWERFSATVFVAHLRGAAKRRTQQDTHPFVRSYGGRDWVLTHNGDLRHGFREALPLPAEPAFEPVGSTDSEHLFCWVLERLRERRVRRLRDLDPATLLGWLRDINTLGTLNLVLSDGQDLVAYSDAFGYRPLWWVRHRPPDQLIAVRDEEVEIKVGTSADTNRTVVVFSSRPLSDAAWERVVPGSLVSARRGEVVWSSEGLPAAWQPAGVVGGEDRRALSEGRPDAALRLSRALEAAERLRSASEGGPAVELPFRTGDDADLGSDATAAALRDAAERLLAPEVLASGLDRETGDDQEDVQDGVRILETWHETIYTYDKTVELSEHVFRLRPVHDATQEVLDHRFHLEPAKAMRAYEDVFGNQAGEATIREPYDVLRIVAQSRVRLSGPTRPRLRAGPGSAGRLPLVWMPWQRQMMTPYLLPMELPESQLRALSDYANAFARRQDGDLVETLKDLNRSIFADYAYETASTQLATTPWEVYTRRKGVCQDFANLFITLARLLGIPARYRVGYIFTGGRYANARQGDASHAWAEVFLPGVGWRGFDPTNGTLTGPDHVRVACGRNYRDATPTAGVLYKGGAGKETLEVLVRVADVTAGSPGAGRFVLGDP